MGLFSRDAPWIRRIFPPSSQPATRQPFAISDDVQLTQDFLAHGQTQDSTLWLDSFSSVNPGAGNEVTLISPTSFVPADSPEVWRMFFIDIAIDGGPTADFNFFLSLFMPATATRVLISQTLRVSSGDADPINIYPQARVNDTFNSTGEQVATPVPLLLPSGPGVNSVNLILTQRSAQAASSELFLVSAYILRNQTGVAHVL